MTKVEVRLGCLRSRSRRQLTPFFVVPIAAGAAVAHPKARIDADRLNNTPPGWRVGILLAAVVSGRTPP